MLSRLKNDAKSTKSRVADNDTLPGDERRKITSDKVVIHSGGKGDIDERTFVTTASSKRKASQDVPNTTGYRGRNLKDTFQEEVEPKVR